jgi:cytochrome oxidase assembly protein ShyY1
VYRFLLSGRWLAFGALVIVVAAVCVRLGMWQFDRLDQRQADNERIEANLAAEPAPIDAVIGSESSVDADDEWRRVTVSGRYDSEHQLVLTQQNRDIGPGVEILTPLVTSDGTAVLVDRGWVAINQPSEVPEPPAPPAGSVSVTGWLHADSDTEDWAVTPDEGTVRAVASDGIAPSLPYDVFPGWVALIEQTPPVGSGLAAPQEPDLGQGPHFFYGLQWWFFAALAVGGYGWFAWTEAHPRRDRRSTSVRQPVSAGGPEN